MHSGRAETRPTPAGRYSMARTSSRAPLALAQALDAHCDRLAGCRRCSNSAGVVPIVSSARAPRAMLVGQAPGQVEMGGGPPFAGRAGKTLFRWLELAGLDEPTAREWLYISAITRCYPGPHAGGRGDRVPSLAERATCGDWLADELRIIRPPLIIPVGRLAIDRFLGPLPLDAAVGREHEVEHEGGNSVAIPLPHPSGASSWVHGAGHRALLDRSLQLIKQRLVPERHRRSVA
jgi:uracil-DNA glycosylase